MSNRLKSVLAKSARVQAAIEAELRRGAPSWLRLLRLKHLRLRLARRLHALARARAAVRPVALLRA
jgi:hypothetical protein